MYVRCMYVRHHSSFISIQFFIAFCWLGCNESTKELSELKAKVSRLEQVLSQKGINLNELLK